MPAISNQYYGTAVSATQNIASPVSQEQDQTQGARRSDQGTPPFRVELSQASIRQAQDSRSQSNDVAPELIKALNNDISRTGSEMNQAITANHLHIAGILSGDAASSFNFFGVAMPLAESGFSFPESQATASAASTGDTGVQASPQQPSAASGSTGSASSHPPQETAISAQEPPVAPQAPPQPQHDQEIIQNAQKATTQDFDQFSTQLSGMAMAATASPAQNSTAAG